MPLFELSRRKVLKESSAPLSPVKFPVYGWYCRYLCRAEFIDYTSGIRFKLDLRISVRDML